MLIKKAADIRESEVTPQQLYVRRREFIAAAGVTAAAVATGGLGLLGGDDVAAQNPAAQKLTNLVSIPLHGSARVKLLIVDSTMNMPSP